MKKPAIIKAMQQRKNAKIKFLTYVKSILSDSEYNAQYKQLAAYTFFMSAGATKNAKTGKIPNVYGCMQSCPVSSCPFKECGCYARQGHCKIWFTVAGGRALKVAKKDEYKTYNFNLHELKKRMQNLPAGILARHNVSGDIAQLDSNDINGALLGELIDVYDGLKGYTYTHCSGNAKNYALLKAAAAAGFTVNKSTETEKQAREAKNAGVPAVLAVEKMEKPIIKKDGVLFVQCPAQKSGGKVDCKTCTACANKNRAAVIVFEAHGAENIVRQIKQANILQKELKA